jgi:hypothetical protein
MIRIFIFWLIVAPASLAFLLGLIASVAQSMVNKPIDDQVIGDQATEPLP